MATRQTYYYNNNRNALTGAEVAQIAYEAGFRGDDLITAVAIAKRESGWKPNVHGSELPQTEYSGDRGLFQINAGKNHEMDRLFQQSGIISKPQDLFNPVVNARAAYLLYKRAGNTFSAWNVGPNGWVPLGTPGSSPTFGTSSAVGQQAVADAQKKGLFGVSWKDTLGTILSPGTAVWNALPGLPDIPNPIDAAGNVVGGITDFVKALLNVHTWVRVLQVVGGGLVFLIGLYVMIGKQASEAVQPIAAVAGAAVKGGAGAA